MTPRVRHRPGIATRSLSGYVGVWRLRACRAFLVAQFVSLLGTSAFRIAIAWYTISTLHSPAALGWVLTAATLPQILIGPVSGAIGDKFGRKRAVVASDVVAGVSFSTMFVFAALGTLGLPGLLVLSIVTGIANAVFVPNASALVPAISDGANVSEANAARMVTAQAASVLGPALAGGLIGVSGVPTVFLVNGLSFLFSALVFGRTRLNVESRENIVAQAEETGSVSLRILRDRVIRAGVVLGAAGNMFVVASVAVLIPALIAAANLGAGSLGAFAAAQAAGLVLGGIAAPGLTAGGRADVRIAFASITLGAVLLYPVAYATSSVYSLTAVGFGVGVALAVFEVHWESYLLQRVDESVLGRACAIDAWASFTGRTVGLVAAGWLLGLASPARGVQWAVLGFIVIAVMVMTPMLFRSKPQKLDQAASTGASPAPWFESRRSAPDRPPDSVRGVRTRPLEVHEPAG